MRDDESVMPLAGNVSGAITCSFRLDEVICEQVIDCIKIA